VLKHGELHWNTFGIHHSLYDANEAKKEGFNLLMLSKIRAEAVKQQKNCNMISEPILTFHGFPFGFRGIRGPRNETLIL
jgi:hypothetical protein